MAGIPSAIYSGVVGVIEFCTPNIVDTSIEQMGFSQHRTMAKVGVAVSSAFIMFKSYPIAVRYCRRLICGNRVRSACAHILQDHYRMAIIAANAALYVNPSERQVAAGMNYLLAKSHHELGEFQAAVHAAQAGLNENPTDSTVIMGLNMHMALSYFELKEYQKTVEFAKVVQLMQNDDSFDRQLAMSMNNLLATS